MPPKENLKTAYDLFLEKGITGAVALLAIAELIWAIARLLKSKDDRIKDQGLFSTTLEKTNAGTAALAIEVNKSHTAALSDASRTNATLTASIQNLEKSIRDLDAKVSSLRDEHVRIVAVLSNVPRGRAR